MYCSECGKKLKKGSLFCGECGAKVKKEKKKIDLKNNKLAIIISSIVALLVICLVTLNILTSPKHIVSKYIKASINKDSNALYSLLDLDGDKTFVSKGVFKKLIDSNLKDSNIENYKIKSVTYDTDKLTAKVLFTYTLKNKSGENTRFIELNKSKDKKYLFFNKWTINGFASSSVIVKDYKILVPKNSKVIYEGIKLTSKYLDKDNKNEKIDVYKLPQVFRTKTTIEATLSNGINIKDEVTPNLLFKQYQLKLTTRNLSDNDNKKIVEVVKNNLELLYKSAIEGKSFNDIKSNFKAKDLTSLENSYIKFSKNLNDRTTKLKNISFDDIDITSAYINNNGELNIIAKAKYDYNVEYNLGEETKESSKHSLSYFTLVFSLENKNYDLVNISGFQTFFYR